MKYILNISIYLSLHAMISMWSVFYTYTEFMKATNVSVQLTDFKLPRSLMVRGNFIGPGVKCPLAPPVH